MIHEPLEQVVTLANVRDILRDIFARARAAGVRHEKAASGRLDLLARQACGRSPDPDRQLPVAEVRGFHALDGLRVEGDEVALDCRSVSGLAASVAARAAVGGFRLHVSDIFRLPPKTGKYAALVFSDRIAVRKDSGAALAIQISSDVGACCAHGCSDAGSFPRSIQEARIVACGPCDFAHDSTILIFGHLLDSGGNALFVCRAKPSREEFSAKNKGIATALEKLEHGFVAVMVDVAFVLHSVLLAHFVLLRVVLLMASVYINQARCQVICEKISEDLREAWEERAAIVEDGCQVSREESERMAAEQMELTDDEIEFLQGSGK